MRQVTSRGSAKSFYLDRDETLFRLREAARDALQRFPGVSEILLFGSLARDTHTGLSDVDLAVVLADAAADDDALERARPFHSFFFERLGISVDLITLRESDRPGMSALLEGAVVLAQRDSCAACTVNMAVPALSGRPATPAAHEEPRKITSLE